MENLEKVTRELWEENPELRSLYNNDFQVFLETNSLYNEWRKSPQLQQEFLGEFKLYVTYKCHEAAGDTIPATGRTIS